MCHAKGDVRVAGAKLESLFAHTGKGEVVILTLIVESHVKCLVNNSCRLGRVRVISFYANVED